MFVLQLYLHGRLTWKGSGLLRPLLQCIAVMMAIYCSLSRISDYKHHWSDVLAGAFFGTVVACISVSTLKLLLGQPIANSLDVYFGREPRHATFRTNLPSDDVESSLLRSGPV